MEIWQRRALGILTIGGGAVGVTNCIALYFNLNKTLEILFVLAAIGIYAWGLWCGMQLLEKQAGSERLVLKFWAIQIPSFGSPIAVYILTSGFQIGLSLQFSPFMSKWRLWLGSSFKFSLLQSSEPWFIGINVFAVAVVWWLYRVVKKNAS